MFFTSVEAGSARSIMLKLSESSFFDFLREISGSEQMQIALMGSRASAVHSLKVCPRSDMDGTRNKIKPVPLVSCSAIRSDTKVLPVPHAIISLPRLAVLKYSWVLSSAAFWCGLISFFGVRECSPVIPNCNFPQSTGASCKSVRFNRVTGGF